MTKQLRKSLSIVSVLVGALSMNAVADELSSDVAEYISLDATFHQTVQNSLKTKLDIDFDQRQLTQIMADLSDRFGVNFLVDQAETQELKLQPTTLRMKNVTLKSVLDELTRIHSLEWCVRSESIVVTTPWNAQQALLVRIFDVTEIVKIESDAGPSDYDFDTLIEAATSTVAPDSWEDVGGEGSMAAKISNSRAMLIVSQRYQVHQLLDRLFAAHMKLSEANNRRAFRGRKSGVSVAVRSSDMKAQPPKRQIRVRSTGYFPRVHDSSGQ